MICPKCHQELYDGAVCCPDCGISVAEMADSAPYSMTAADASGENKWLWRILGFCLGYGGFILWAVYRRSNPVRAKASAQGALVSSVLGTLAECFVAYIMVCHSDHP